MEIVTHRKPMQAVRRRLEEGQLTVGFIGTSITDARVEHNWPEPLMRWLIRQYPAVRFKVENAAIAATGSELAVFRAKRDLLDKGCDLIFVEYAVNDPAEPTGKRHRTRESLLRHLIGPDRDIVLVYTYHQNMYADLAAGVMPASIAEFEILADYYGLNSVWMSLHSYRQVRQGWLRWEEWLPDGLHPTERGSLSYAESVIAFWQESFSEYREPKKEPEPYKGLPAPLDPWVWDKIEPIPLRTVAREGPWLLRNWPRLPWIEELLETSAVGAKLRIPFEGRGIALGFDFGYYSAEYNYRLDEGEWRYSNRERPPWYPDHGLFLVDTLYDQLPAGRHVLEIEVVHGNTDQCKGTHFRLAFAVSIQ